MKPRKSVKTKRRKTTGNYRYYLRKYLKLLKSIIKVFVFVLLLLGIAYLFLFSKFFNIETILVSGTEEFVNPQDVEQLAIAKSKNKNIFKFNAGELETNLTNSLLGAQSFEVNKVLPNKIKIIVHERKPIAIVYQDKEEYFLVDGEGYVLGYTNPGERDLPKINFEEEIKIGFFIDENVVPVYLELHELFQKEKIKVSTMSFYPEYVNFKIESGPEVFLGSDKSRRESVLAISSLLKQTDVEDKEIQRIDLRYDKVIVSFK